jgi:hypothetical protein
MSTLAAEARKDAAESGSTAKSTGNAKFALGIDK